MLKTTTIQLPGSEPPKANPLPFFGSSMRNTAVKTHPDLPADDKHLLGYETAPRFLPYKKQDSYTRAAKIIQLDAIELENEHLKATFLPQYGGRLYSLYHKGLSQELLFNNPVIQPANLAVLDAWIAGGIEWNVGQFGHAVTTSSPVFCAEVEDDSNGSFLRIYEYERMHGLVWQLDFHLPPGSQTLNLCARIQNASPRDTSLYYWTNIAAVETQKTRVFSGTSDVLYLDMQTGELGRGMLPHLPTMPGKDATFPQNFAYSNEYFFQTPAQEPSPWQAAVQPGGWMLYERSTPALRYRKMFCWGAHSGGRRWKDYLSLPGEGDYVEIQAGLAPTQQHGLVLPAGGVVQFAQCFGGAKAPAADCIAPAWHTAQANTLALVDAALPPTAADDTMRVLSPLLDKEPRRLLYNGSGFGALENARREKLGEAPLCPVLPFAPGTMGAEQAPWLHLLQKGVYPAASAQGCPPSYMTQPEWAALLEKSIKTPLGVNHTALLQHGIVLAEQGRVPEARAAFMRAEGLGPGMLSARCLGFWAAQQGQKDKAAEWYDKSLAMAQGPERIAVLCEYLGLLNEWQSWPDAWALYQAQPPATQANERLTLLALLPALHCGQLNIARTMLGGCFACVRENATILSDAWILLHQLEEKRRSGQTPTPAEAESRWPVPYELDFRMRT